MNIVSLLEELGLKQREAEAYLALLELGEASVQAIATKAGQQRPNCYVVLEALAKKGLVSHQTKEGPRRYIAEDPSKLKTLLQQKSELLETSLPNLRSLYSQGPSKPRARFYEGLEGIMLIYEEILSSPGFDCVWSPEILIPIVGDYTQEVGRQIVAKKMRVREVITGKVLSEYQQKFFTPPLQQLRYYAKGNPAETDLMLFNDKAALISYKPDIHALVVEGSGIVQTLKLMFEAIWEASSPEHNLA